MYDSLSSGPGISTSLLVGFVEDEGSSEGEDDGTADIDGSRVGWDDGPLEMDGTRLGSLEGVFEVEGLSEGEDDGTADIDGSRVGWDDGPLEVDGTIEDDSFAILLGALDALASEAKARLLNLFCSSSKALRLFSSLCCVCFFSPLSLRRPLSRIVRATCNSF